MVGVVEIPTSAAPPAGLGFSVSHQKVHLNIDLAGRKLRGTTEITISPHSADLKTIRLSCRQCHLNRLSVNGKPSASMTYTDPFKQAKLRWRADVHQYHMLQERLEAHTKVLPEYELVVNLPKSIKIQELDPFSTVDSARKDVGDPNAVDFISSAKLSADPIARFTPITVYIDFTIDNIREGLHFVGWGEDDLRYPHAYSQKLPTSPSCSVFPCLDAIDSRSTWEISIKCPRTIGDALRRPEVTTNGLSNRVEHDGHEDELVRALSTFTREDQALDLMVVCSGNMTDEIVDTKDPTKKTTSFVCSSPVAPQHIGFAIGPFEYVNLAAFRESDEDDKLGQNAVPVHGFCLPGRAQEMKNTCLPLAKAIDFFTMTYGSFPFSSYKICFLDDMVQDCTDTASLSMCSNRLLFPDDIIEPLDRVTRQLVYALACQWVGVNIIPKDGVDTWAVVGMAYFIVDVFMRKLSGNNEYRYHQKEAADRVVELDVARPSIYECGRWLWLDSSHLDFIAAKAPLVLFILDRRLTKASGSSGLSRIISRVFLNAKVGDLPNGALNTPYFMKTCEKLGHAKLDIFFNQWVLGAGCPRFRVTQRFNKKRLVVEMLIQQAQGDMPIDQDLKSNTFMRDVKEDFQEVDAEGVQPVFTGPMTIRIHEADGTPYEHIVEIKEATTKFDIPYNTKYKRLKRSRRQRERTTIGGVNDFSTENQDDVLFYCLGDVLQSEHETREWRLTEWSKEDEDRMSQESYEWIRMDADFEWICKMSVSMPGYMYLSQLQQDRDVVAQLESIQYMGLQREHPLVSTILIRTLMDSRYFHGIRTTAAAALVRQAKDETSWLGQFHLEKAFQELFCISDSRMTRTNDFSNRASYYVQCAIIKAISKIRDNNGKAPLSVRKFLFEKLRYNDNSDHEYSDCHYLATLMTALAKAISTTPPSIDDMDTDFASSSEEQHLFTNSLEEIDRYRRVDEWIPSYHNIISTTALNNQALLIQTGCIPLNAVHFLQYTQPGSSDYLRLTAFSCLMDLGQHKVPQILAWFLHALGYDASPHIRNNLLRLFGRILGAVAIGEAQNPTSTSVATIQQNGLIIEQDATTSERQADLARKQTIPGALAALRTELSDNESLKKALWSAIESPSLTLHELNELLEICALLYKPETRMLLALRYPRYWRCVNQGRINASGQPARQMITFKQTERVRTKPIPKITLRVPPPTPPPPALKRQASSGVAAPPVRTLLKPPKPPPGHKSANAPAQPAPASVASSGLPANASNVQGETKPKLTIKLNLKKGGLGGASGPKT